MESSKPKVIRLILKFSKDFIRPHSYGFMTVAFLMCATILLQLPIPLLTMYMIDNTIASQGLTVVSRIMMLLTALIVVKHIISFINETLTLKLKETIVFEVQNKLIKHIHDLPLGFFSNKHSTYLQSRVMNDSRAVEGALVRTIVSIFVDVLTFIVGLSMIVYIRYELGLLLIAFLLPFAYVRYYANDKMRVLSQGMQETQAVTSSVIGEDFSAIRTIKGFNRQDYQENLLSGQLDLLKNIYVKTNRFGILSSTGTSLITSLSLAFVIWYGCNSVVSGTMTIGEVFAVTGLLGYLFGPINGFVATNLQIQQATVAIERIYEFLNEPAEQFESAVLPNIKGDIVFENVEFSYESGNRILNGVNLHISSGETVALVGKTGAGKSTLTNLLLKFYSPQAGGIFIDGKNIGEMSNKFLRESIGIVDQQTFLFSGSIYDNIKFGNPAATDEEVFEACRQSYSEEFIEKLPDGYNTVVGERGVRLSGGQSQRIAIARMFLKNPDILILDEAVSAIDSNSESFIQEALRSLTRSRTTIIVAHRLSSLVLADRVFVLENGVIIEEGSHTELLTRESAYSKLFHEQINTKDQIGSRDFEFLSAN